MGDDLGWSAGELALGLTFRLAVAGVTAPFLGMLARPHRQPRPRHRRGRHRRADRSWAVGFVDELWMFYLLFAISGLSGFGGPSGQLLTMVPVAKWFQAKRGRALAIATIGMPARQPAASSRSPS